MTNPYSPPQTESEQILTQEPYEIALTWKRFLNYLLDSFFYLLLLTLIGFLVGFVGGLLLEDSMDKIMASGFYTYGLSYGFLFLYFWLSELLTGKTPAKFITRTRVIHQNGSKPTAGQIAMRTLFRFVPFDVFSFLGSNNPVGWHDKWSKTIVVNDSLKTKKIQLNTSNVFNPEPILDSNANTKLSQNKNTVQNATEFADMDPFKVPFDAPDSNFKKKDDIDTAKNPYS